MIAEIVLAVLMLEATMAEPHQMGERDSVRDYVSVIQQALNKGKFGECARNCPTGGLTEPLCKSICTQQQGNFKQLTVAAQHCLSQPLCGIDLRNVQLNRITIPIQNENFNGRCVLQGDGTASISFGNYVDAVTFINNLRPQPAYIDDVSMSITWDNFNVYCAPCYLPKTGTGFGLFDVVTCVGTGITKWIGVDLFKCPADKLGGFSGRVKINQKFVPRYLYVFIPPRNANGINREATYNLGYGGSDVDVVNFDSAIPSNNQTDISNGIRDALTSPLLLDTFNKYFYDVYNSLYSFHVAAKCKKCPVTPLPK